MAATTSLPPPTGSSSSSSTITTTSSNPPSSSSSSSSSSALISRKKTSPIPCNYGDLLNHEKYSKLCDMVFVVEGKNIYTVRAVIQKRLPHLAKAPPTVVNRSKTAKDLSLTTLELKDTVPYDSMLALFEYAYTGTVDMDKMSMRQVMALLGVANKVGVDAVVNLCERRLKQQLSLEVVFALMKLAHDLDMVSIKSVCMDYCMLNYAQVVGRKDGIATIGIDLFQEMTMEHMKQREIPPIVPNELSPDTLAADFTAIFQEMAHADAFMQFDQRKIMFHRAIVATGSDRLLAAMIQQASNGSSKKPAQVQLPVLTEGAFSGLLQLIYSGFSSLTPVAACSLITHSVVPLELPAVQTFCEAVVHDISLVNALTVLELTYLPIYKARGDITVSLREKALSFVVANFPQISVLHIEHMPPHICLDILRAIHAHQKLYGVSAADQDVSFNRSTPNLKALVTPRDADDDRRRKKSTSSSSSSRKKRDTIDDSGVKDGLREKKHRSKDIKERSTVASSSSSSSITTPPTPTTPTSTSTPPTSLPPPSPSPSQ